MTPKEQITAIWQTIREQREQGNIVIADFDGLKTTPLAEFLDQPADGILYDLNRLEACTLTLAEQNPEDLRWINDLAVAMVIRELKGKTKFKKIENFKL